MKVLQEKKFMCFFPKSSKIVMQYIEMAKEVSLSAERPETCELETSIIFEP